MPTRTKAPAAYRVIVSGRGAFPIDMLRFDRATPYAEADSGLIARSFDERTPRCVKLFMPGRPTTRWASFGWHIDSCEASV